MEVCKCSKEKKIDETHDKVLIMETKVDDIHTIVKGNGQTGLIQRMRNLENRWAYYAGGLGVLVLILQLIL